jgi:type IV pilus assembly protein PilN
VIRINLLPTREQEAEVGRRQELVIAGVSLALTVIVLGAVFLNQASQVSGLEDQLGQLTSEITAINAKAKGVAELKNKIKTIRERLRIIDELSKKKTGPVRVMESLSSSTPKRLWLTEFKESGGAVTLSGLAIDNQTIAEFLKALSSSPYFQNVELVETTQVEEKGGRLKKFVMRSGLLYQLPQKAQQAKKDPVPDIKNRG